MAGLTALAVTLVLAIGGYGMPAWMSLSAATYGVAFGLLPISWILVWANRGGGRLNEYVRRRPGRFHRYFELVVLE
jgi:hypothetical protein